ncbi:MAG: bile acid:sodium symporter [Bacillota bacterium]|nr:bile acid:sodium symporter [Bacillota bacterium]
MIKVLKWISDHLLFFVVVVGTFSMIFPKLGSSLGGIVTPVLALMVLSVSMTIKVEDLKQIKKYPKIILWSVFLQFVPMVLFSFMLGKIFFKSGDISTGQLLLGSLPADISAPLMVYLVGGSTALATAMLVAAMILTPFVLPNVLTFLGGVTFKVPTSYLIIELAGIILIPAILGVLLNYFSKKVREKEEAWSGAASVCYIILLFVVVSSNAKAIIALKVFALLILFVEILLNLFGYLLAYITKLIFKQNNTYYPILFLVSSKEFGIASAAVDTMKLNTSIVIPSAFYAVVQMVSLPIMVSIVNKYKSSSNPNISNQK